MTRRTSEDNDKAYLNGEVITVLELKKRFSLAITLNNNEIFKSLSNAKKPISTKDLLKEIGMVHSTQFNAIMKKLFDNGLVVRFWAGRGFLYLLTEKGYHNYLKAKKVIDT